MNRQYRHFEGAVDLRNPAQAVTPQAVGIWMGADFLRCCVQRGSCGRIAVNCVAQSLGVQHFLGQDAIDGAVTAKAAIRKPVTAPISKPLDKHGALATCEVFNNRRKLRAFGRGDDGQCGGRSRRKTCKQTAADLGLHFGPFGKWLVRDIGKRLGGKLHTGKTVKQLNVCHHAAHGQGCVVTKFVDSRCQRFGLYRSCGNVPAHRDSRDVGA